MKAAHQPPSPVISTLAIVGVGLIGGSIAAAVRPRHIAERVIGIGRNKDRLEAARRAGLIDEAATDHAAAHGADLVIVCTPVDRIAADVLSVCESGREGLVVTDAGSVKAAICQAVRARLPREKVFVGSHPLAGSEKGGFEHAEPDLFEGRVCVMTPDDRTPAHAVEFVRRFWEALGLRVVEMSAEAHDEILALTSHLPHAVAAMLASLLTAREADFAASGFRDTTRIAAGDPDLWTAIFHMNSGPLTAQLERLQRVLEDFREAVAAQDTEKLRRILQQAREQRERLG